MNVNAGKPFAEIGAACICCERDGVATCHQFFGNGDCREDMSARAAGRKKNAASTGHRRISAPIRLRVRANRNPMHSPIAIRDEPP